MTFDPCPNGYTCAACEKFIGWDSPHNCVGIRGGVMTAPRPSPHDVLPDQLLLAGTVSRLAAAVERLAIALGADRDARLDWGPRP